MVGPFKRSKDKKTHLLVVVDKFTKWVEAEPVSKCDAATAVQFIKKVIFHFGFPHSIITDNGTNLSKGAMEEFCQREHIRLDVSSVAHPQSNGQAERANQEILRGIKPRLMVPLQRTPGCWVEELPSVLWSINTTPTGLRVIRLSSWFTEQRQFSLVTSVMTHLGWRLMLKRTMNKHVRKHWTCWMRSMTLQRLVRRFISRICTVTTVAGLKPELSKKAIWCSGLFRIRLICTSYPHLGKDLLWSAKICTMDHTTLSMFESTKTHVNRRRRPSGCGI